MSTPATNYDHLLKIIIIGPCDKVTGKSSISHRIANEDEGVEFNSDNNYTNNITSSSSYRLSPKHDATIGVEFETRRFSFNTNTGSIKTLNTSKDTVAAASPSSSLSSKEKSKDEVIFKLQMWDTAGMSRFNPITRSYYRGSHVAFFVFSMDDAESFQKTPERLHDYKKVMSDEEYDQCYKVLIGNKMDKVDQLQVTESELEAMVEKEDFDKAVCVSALTGEGFDELVTSIFSHFAVNGYSVNTGGTKEIPAFAQDCVATRSSTNKNKNIKKKKKSVKRSYFPSFKDILAGRKTN